MTDVVGLGSVVVGLRPHVACRAVQAVEVELTLSVWAQMSSV